MPDHNQYDAIYVSVYLGLQTGLQPLTLTEHTSVLTRRNIIHNIMVTGKIVEGNP